MSTELPPIDPALRIGHAALAVSDLSRSIDFYEQGLGLPLISSDSSGALLGPEREHPMLALTQLPNPTAPSPGSTGLFHIAYLHPSRASLAATVRRLAAGRWPFEGTADHGVSEALYLSDPDGLGIEIYVDRPRELWERTADGHGVQMVSLPLDLDDLLHQGPAQASVAMPAESIIGHVHLKVSDVPRSVSFYRDSLGLEEQAQLPSAGFLSAGGYHHHIGVNSWQSRKGSPDSERSPGLRLVEFELSSPEALASLERRLLAEADANRDSSPTRAPDGALVLRDPDGQALEFSVSPERARARA